MGFGCVRADEGAGGGMKVAVLDYRNRVGSVLY